MRLGFIGAGFITQSHAAALRQVRGITVEGILKRTQAAAISDYCQKHGIGSAQVFDSVTEMAKHVDVLAIYSPNFSQVETMEEIVHAVKEGAEVKGVICEKPLGRNLQEARRLLELAQEVNLLTAYFENQIFMKMIQVQRQQLFPVQRKMGPLMLVRSAEEHSGPHSSWFWDPVRMGGGVLLDMGCHSIGVNQFVLTPEGKDISFLKPISVEADVSLLKWGQPVWREKLLAEKGVDYRNTPADDFTTGIITYQNPDTGQKAKAQFTNSWMYEKQGFRLVVEGIGPGYAFDINSLRSPLELFISDAATEALADSEAALEKSTSSRGLLTVQYNEADLYGFVDENIDMLTSFKAGRDGFLSWKFGAEITKLVMAAYMAAEQKKVIDLTNRAVEKELETYVPLIQQGNGKDQLL